MASFPPNNDNHNHLNTRYATLDDARVMDRIQRDVFGNSGGGAPFSRELRQSNISYILAVRPMRDEEARNSRTRASRGLQDLANWITVRLRGSSSTPRERSNGDHVSGFVGVWTAVDQAHIVAIAVRPDERRRGVGELLLIAALKEASRKGARTATLEVRKSNSAAKSLYRKYGFTETGIRRRYYADNGEDAVIMTTPFIDNATFAKLFEKRVNSFENMTQVRARPNRI